MIKYITPALLICTIACGAENTKTEKNLIKNNIETVVNKTIEPVVLVKSDSITEPTIKVIEEAPIADEPKIKGAKKEEVIEEVIESPEPKNESLVAYSPSHSAFNALLAKHVSASGKVNYEGFKIDKSKLDEYLVLLSKNAPSEKWTKDEQLTYWINLYNAATIQLILKYYPIKSIMDINGGKAWDFNFISSGKNMLSLNQIENEIIRPQFNEPRIHFAVNCAAISCPKLLNSAFYAHTLNKQLETATKKFINNSNKNVITKNSIKISKIFEWYAADFGGKSNFIEFFNKYSNSTIDKNAKISFMEYDWNLNN